MSTRENEMMAEKKSFLPYHLGYLTDWMVTKAEKDLNETEENRKVGLAKFRRLIAEDKGINVWTDDSYLLQYLRARKFNVERAWDLLRNFRKLFKDYPDVYRYDTESNITEALKSFMKSNVCGGCPYRDADGNVVLIFNFVHWDPDEYPVSIPPLAIAAMLLASIEDVATQVTGVRIIYDAPLTMKHFRTCTPRIMNLFAKSLRNTLPISYKGIHVVNGSIFFTYLYNIVKYFLPEKIRKRFHIHGSDMNSLHKYIPKEILPPEYGGDCANYCASDWCKNVIDPFLGRYMEMINKCYT